MNRAQRRAQQRVRTEFDAVMSASEADGRPWHVYGMTAACSDCQATADLHGIGRTGPIRADIWHASGCPTAAGVTAWKPVPID